MRLFLRITCLLAILVSCLVTSAFADEPDDGKTKFEKKSFNDLSERSVSRKGDEALAMRNVTWEHGESDHFILHTETGFSAPQLASTSEWAYEAIKKELGITQDSFERKCQIFVFLNEPAWLTFVGGTKLDMQTGGWCTGRELFMQSRPHFKFQGSTLPHEVTHLVLHRFIGGDIPLWLNEGFAEFEGIRLYRGYLKARNYTLTGVQDKLDRELYVPLKELTTMVDYPRGSGQIGAFYVESHRLVAFLFLQHGGMAPLLKFMKLQSQGARFDTAWKEIYGAKYFDLADFETKFMEFLIKGKDDNR